MPVRIGNHAGDAFQDTGHVGAHRNETALAQTCGQAGLAGHQQQLLMLRYRSDRPDGQALAGIEGVDAGGSHPAQTAIGIAEQQLATGIERQR